MSIYFTDFKVQIKKENLPDGWDVQKKYKVLAIEEEETTVTIDKNASIRKRIKNLKPSEIDEDDEDAIEERFEVPMNESNERKEVQTILYFLLGNLKTGELRFFADEEVKYAED